MTNAQPNEQATWPLNVSAISKSFDGNQVLADVNLQLAPGQVVGLVGANGAGKSTLAKLLANQLAPDSGEIWVAGELLQHGDAASAGAAMVEQRISLDPEMRVAEAIYRNTALKQEPYAKRRAAAQRVLMKLGMVLYPDDQISQLSHAEIAMLEVARMLAEDSELVVLDEVDGGLNPRELHNLRYVLAQLTKDGKAVLYITQRTEEARTICNRMVVLRDGTINAELAAEDASEEELSSKIFATTEEFEGRKAPKNIGPTLLSVGDLVIRQDAGPQGLELSAGEVLGMIGDRDGGIAEFINALTGDEPAKSGTVTLAEQVAEIRHPKDAVELGISYLPLDSDGAGLSIEMALARSMLIGQSNLEEDFDAEVSGLVEVLQQLRAAERRGQRMLPESLLSTGQRQLRRLREILTGNSQVAILEEPSRGLDFMANARLGQLLNQFTGLGKAVIITATDVRSLLRLSDRVAVWTEGEITAYLDPRKTDPDELTKMVYPDADLEIAT